ncbi:MAG: DUF4258 domain-containing protein [Nitrospirae bacterium]|nr:DUF4258 domain-containing protein [Nitrospirota bacterium]MBF0534559.1 DUF4258 domain-containing protein [Nitrospirota bacterium]MBF0617594.1 DUF4258 domain-containing protein [Nitrospirota bacterium]
MIIFHPHAKERLTERGATEQEAISTVQNGEMFTAKFGRTGFRRNFNFAGQWRGRHYEIKQVEVYAVKEDGNWIIITVITRYF